jgi:hypothetical protein
VLNTIINVLIALAAVYRPATFVKTPAGMRIWSRRLESNDADWSYELQLCVQSDRNYRLVLVNLHTRDKRQWTHQSLWSALRAAQKVLDGFHRRRHEPPRTPTSLTEAIASQEQPFGAVALSGAPACTSTNPGPARTTTSRPLRSRPAFSSSSSMRPVLPTFSPIRRWRRH